MPATSYEYTKPFQEVAELWYRSRLTKNEGLLAHLLEGASYVQTDAILGGFRCWYRIPTDDPSRGENQKRKILA